MFLTQNRKYGSTPNNVLLCDETMTSETPLSHYARHVRGFLRNSTATASLLDEIKRQDNLLEQVRRAIPAAIRSHCKQASIQNARLTLLVDSPAWVARLKLHSPQLLDALANTREHCTACECRVRVMPEQPAIANKNLAQGAPFSPNAARHLLQAAECVTSPELAESLKRLASNFAAHTPPS